jgi:hypothetical protein
MIRFGFLSVRELYLEETEVIDEIISFALDISARYNLPVEILKPAQKEVLLCLENLVGLNFSNDYAWYVKIPSIPLYLDLITPILEKRLYSSKYMNFTGDLIISYYKGGIKLKFIEGNLDSLKELSILEIQNTKSNFNLQIPPNDFLHLLLGNKSIYFLKSESHDINFELKQKNLLEVLFPLIRASLTPAI